MMHTLQSEFLFEMSVTVKDALQIGQTPFGHRHLVSIAEGSFEGPKLKGQVLADAGGDWLIARPDDAVQLDARLVLQVSNGEYVLMSYRGIRHGSPQVMERLAEGKNVDPSEYYFRAAPFFETSSENYGWLNRIVSVATGHRSLNRVTYQVYQIL